MNGLDRDKPDAVSPDGGVARANGKPDKSSVVCVERDIINRPEFLPVLEY